MKLEVYKFGGASVKNAEAIKNVAAVLRHHQEDNQDKRVIVISAMDKTTNRLEEVVRTYFKEGDWKTLLEDIKSFHLDIIEHLQIERQEELLDWISHLFQKANTFLEGQQRDHFNFVYDQIVSMGELLSTRIISTYLNQVELSNTWLDVRKVIKTDHAFTEALVDFPKTEALIRSAITEDKQPYVITQGFLGSTPESLTTTLGREGSDYTASIFAYALEAGQMSIWKDVPGVLNADPKHFEDTVFIPNISYHEAIEMAYYGAKIIHPKTIKPLQNRSIPLHIRSFVDFKSNGTVITPSAGDINYPPIIVHKKNQILISFAAKDFSFVDESSLSKIFNATGELRLRGNMMQNAAISFSICVDDHKEKIDAVIDKLKDDFTIRLNRNLELLTIRHFNKEVFDTHTNGKEILLQQKSRSTIQVVMR